MRKDSSSAPAVKKRSEDSGCGAAHALGLVGDRWALLVVRELLLGPKRFTDVLAGLPGASPDMVTQRLRELNDTGVVRRRQLPPPTPIWVYELTPWGAELEQTLVALGRWGGRSPSMPADAIPGVDAFMLLLKAIFEPKEAAKFTATVAFIIDREAYEFRVVDGQLVIKRGSQDRPDVRIEADLATVSGLLRGEKPIREVLVVSKDLSDEERQILESFRGLFRWPEMASAEERS